MDFTSTYIFKSDDKSFGIHNSFSGQLNGQAWDDQDSFLYRLASFLRSVDEVGHVLLHGNHLEIGEKILNYYKIQVGKVYQDMMVWKLSRRHCVMFLSGVMVHSQSG